MLMRTKLSLVLSFCIVASTATQAWGDKLGVGDPAPDLVIAKWIKGDLVDLAKGDAIYVVEFWATWCPPCKTSIPHLTELQDKFEDHGVVVLAVSDEDVEKVSKFVKKMGDTMQYRVAVDKERTTSKRYMKAAGQRGIPHVFLEHPGSHSFGYGKPHVLEFLQSGRELRRDACSPHVVLASPVGYSS